MLSNAISYCSDIVRNMHKMLINDPSFKGVDIEHF